MRDRIKRLEDLLDGLLDYARIGQTEQDIKLLDLTALSLEIRTL